MPGFIGSPGSTGMPRRAPVRRQRTPSPEPDTDDENHRQPRSRANSSARPLDPVGWDMACDYREDILDVKKTLKDLADDLTLWSTNRAERPPPAREPWYSMWVDDGTMYAEDILKRLNEVSATFGDVSIAWRDIVQDPNYLHLSSQTRVAYETENARICAVICTRLQRIGEWLRNYPGGLHTRWRIPRAGFEFR